MQLGILKSGWNTLSQGEEIYNNMEEHKEVSYKREEKHVSLR